MLYLALVSGHDVKTVFDNLHNQANKPHRGDRFFFQFMITLKSVVSCKPTKPTKPNSHTKTGIVRVPRT
jgi:hypothetical protein